LLFSFLSLYSAHRDLHPFPTRRSSDLDRRQQRVDLVDDLAEWRAVRGARLRQRDRDLGADPAGIAAENEDAVGHLDRLLDVVRQDRKSTRLNSSHQIISYAVFCLKKKI